MSSIFRRNQTRNQTPEDDEVDEDDQVDPELRLRTVRTATSAIAESIRSEQRMERRKARRRRIWGSLKTKKPPSNAGHDSELRLELPAGHTAASGKPRRNIYVNCGLLPQDTDAGGHPFRTYVRNKVKTSSASGPFRLRLFLIWNSLTLASCRVHNCYIYTQEPVRTVPTRR
jgi:phospholipid-translocating ATPase